MLCSFVSYYYSIGGTLVRAKSLLRSPTLAPEYGHKMQLAGIAHAATQAPSKWSSSTRAGRREEGLRRPINVCQHAHNSFPQEHIYIPFVFLVKDMRQTSPVELWRNILHDIRFDVYRDSRVGTNRFSSSTIQS